VLAGTQLKSRVIAALAYAAGWHDIHQLAIAVSVCSAESSRYTEADNLDAAGQPTNPDGTVDYGLWQVNSRHFGQTLAGHLVTKAACFDPPTCAAIAHALQKKQGWTPWAAYTSGRYLDDLPGALNGIRYWQLILAGLPLPT
jgi:hypothetical protein